ncbi:MAG: riboflavin synthase [Pseudomonadales bacterium]|nr:riboflavin synthase [Pseudomonadales bacterium]
MFTGIIEAVGTVRSLEQRSGDLRLVIDAGQLDMNDVKRGDSIATQGVCLTVVDLPAGGFAADVSLETVSHSTLANWHVGQLVNLEKAMLPTTRFGGHMVSGHVDGVGEIIACGQQARALTYQVRAPANLLHYIALKGSMAVDGISLTVNGLRGNGFDLTVVPHTVQQTALRTWRTGAQVNLEVDLIARYLERLMQPEVKDAPGRLDQAFLAKHGYLNRS